MSLAPKHDVNHARGFQFGAADQTGKSGFRAVQVEAQPNSGIDLSVSLPNIASNTVEGPPSIVELARALKNDPQLIYQYVQNNIEWEPGWGVQKGALGCLMDGMGNAFDQCMLMVALLRQAGFTANYVQGAIQLLDTQFEAWWNVQDIWTAQSYCLNTFIPIVALPTWNGTQYDMQISHVWVQCVIGGTTYVFDPSLKSYNRKTGIGSTALASALGYTASTFLSDAESGATVDPSGNFVQSMNSANIRADLKTFASNLSTYIKSNAIGSAPAGTATVDDLLGGQTIVPTTTPLLQTSLSYAVAGYAFTQVWTGDVPASYKATLRVQYPNGSGGWSIDQTFNSDQLAGGRLTVWFNGSLQPVLYLNGTAVQTGNAQGAGTWNSIQLTVVHNAFIPVNTGSVQNYPTTYPGGTGGFQLSYQNTWQWWQSFIYAGFYYLIANAWGNLGRGQTDFHLTQMAANQAAGGASTSEPILGEQLSVTWFTWSAQNSKVADLVNRIMNCHTMYCHQVGIISFDSLFGTDLGGVVGSSTYLPDDSTFAAKTAINDTVLAMHGVALEAAVLSQMIGSGTGASTTTVIDAANTAGNKIYKGTSANWTAGINVSGTLVANGYNATDMSNINSSYIGAGDSVVIADHPNETIGGWQGWGYWAYPTAGAFGIINGGLKGGKQPGTPTPIVTPPRPIKGGSTGEPIILESGDFILNRTDISVGSEEFPYRLSFGRAYTSANQYVNGPLGRGWSHDQAITAAINSDGLLAMGDQFALQGVISIAELFVCTDLVADTTRPVAKLVTMTLADKWWIDQITSNTVVLNFPGKGSYVFVKQADGSYTSPFDYPGTLTLSSGLFTLNTPQGIKYNFNASGQIASWVSPAGVTITYTYASGLLSTVSNGLGRTLTLHYTSGQLTSVTDGNGRTVSYGFDVNNNLTSFTDATSKTFTYSYDQPGRMTKFFKPANPLTAYITNVYDSLSRVKTQANALGDLWTYYFAGERSEEDDPLSNAHVWYFNRFGSITRDINALGFETDSVYDGLNRLIQRTLPEGNQTLFTYDSNNNVLTKTLVPKSGSGLSNVVNTSTYDPTWAKLKTFKDGNLNTTTYSYDPTTGNLLTIQRPAVGGSTPTVTFTYNARGQVATKTDETNIVTKFTYDVSTEKLLSVVLDYSTLTGHLNLTTQYGYDAVGNTNSITDPNSNVTASVYDNERRLTQVTSPSPFSYVSNFGYDANGNMLTAQKQTGNVTTPWQTNTWTYSVSDKKKTLTDPATDVTTWNYDGKDRLANVIDALSREYQYSYDALDRIHQITDPSLTVSETRLYTNNGLLASVEDANSHTTQYTYDGLDRRNKTIYADASFEQNTSYDANNNVLTFTTRSGNTIVNTYDTLNRLSTKAPTGEGTVTFAYDLANRPLSASKPAVSGDPSTGLFQRVYDSAGRFVQETYPATTIFTAEQVTFQLDNNGNVTKLTYADGYFVTRAFDQLNRLTGIKLNGSTTSAVQLAYDELSRRTTLTYSNGASVAYGYQSAIVDDLITELHSFVGASVTLTYGYNADHEINSLAVSDNTYMWHPGAGGTSTYMAANSVNEYPKVGSNSYTYDGNGNLKTDGVWTYTYDTENHLTAVSKTGTSLALLYDPWQRQAQKSVTTTGTVKSRYVYSGWQRIADYDGTSGALQNRYVYGTGLDEPLIQVTSGGTLTFYHANHQGSIVAVSSNAGAVTNKNPFGPFGEITTLAGTTFGFTGQRYDPETGLHYYKNRYYSSAIGRFMQPDPVRYVDGLNLYRYAENDPISNIDPLGLVAGSTTDDMFDLDVQSHTLPPITLPDPFATLSVVTPCPSDNGNCDRCD
jgi:RHS repeat-associated protein